MSFRRTAFQLHASRSPVKKRQKTASPFIARDLSIRVDYAAVRGRIPLEELPDYLKIVPAEKVISFCC